MFFVAFVSLVCSESVWGDEEAKRIADCSGHRGCDADQGLFYSSRLDGK